MKLSDYVVVATPLTENTRGLIGKSALSCAKKDQVLINIARGPVVDEVALLEALKSGQLLGAALDVFNKEPLPPSSPLWSMPNILISPHNADKTVDFRHRSIRFFTENCKRFLSNEKLHCIVNFTQGY